MGLFENQNNLQKARKESDIMAIKIPQGYDVTSHEPIDKRLLLTYEEMRNVREEFMPERYFAAIKDATPEDRDVLFIYDKSFEFDNIYGKFRPIYKIGETAEINDVPVEGNVPFFDQVTLVPDDEGVHYKVKNAIPDPTEDDYNKAVIIDNHGKVTFDDYGHVDDVLVGNQSVVADRVAKVNLGAGFSYNDKLEFDTSDLATHNEVDTKITAAVDAEKDRAEAIEADLQNAIETEKTRATNAELLIMDKVSDEEERALNAEANLLGSLDAKQNTMSADAPVYIVDDTVGINLDNKTIKTVSGKLQADINGMLPTKVAGKALTVAADGNTLTWAEAECKVENVKVAGTSVVTNKIAEIDKAGEYTFGVVKLDNLTIKTNAADKIEVDALAAINKTAPVAGNDGKALIYDGTNNTLKWGEAGKVEDVRIGATSLVTNKIATIPVAAASTLGVVKTQTNGTVAVDAAGTLSAVVDTASGLKITTNGIAADDTKLQKKLTADSPIEITTADHIKLNSGNGLEVSSNKLVVKPNNTPLEGVTLSVGTDGVHAKAELDDTMQIVATGTDKGKLSVKDVKLDILKNKTTTAYKANGNKLSTYIKSTLGDNLANPGDPALYNDIVLTEDLIAAVSQNLGIFRGTHDSEGDLPTTALNNDYAFILDDSTPGMVYYKRYKFDGTQWKYEYTLANTSYTTAQWNALNSGATSTIINSVNGKQDQVAVTAPIKLAADNKTISLDYDTTTLKVASNKLAGNYTASNGIKLVGADIQALVDGTSIKISSEGKLTAGGSAPHEHANKATLDKIQNPAAADVGKALVYNGSTIGWGEAGQVDDVKVNGTSVVTSKTAAITTPTVGTSGQLWVSSGTAAGTGVTMPGSWKTLDTAISSTSTAAGIPSSKAVYDYAQPKLTAEKGIEITTANKIGHKETYTAQTTEGIFPITVDAYGHVASLRSEFDPTGIVRWATAANENLLVPDPVAGQFISYDGTTKKLIWKAGGGGSSATYVEGTNIELVPDPTTGEVTINVVNVPVYQAGSGITISGNTISTVAANPSFSQLTGSPADNTALKDALDSKQAKLTAGDYINIAASGDNLVISATGLPEFKESDSIAIADDGTISVAATVEAGDGIKIDGSLADGTVKISQDVLTTLSIGSNKVPTSKAVADYIATLNHKTKQTAIDTSTTAVSGQATDVIVGFKQNANGEITDVIRKSLGGTPSDAKIDFQINGTSKGSFTLNQTAAGTINYAPSYNDLSDKPTITPTNDGKLTLTNTDGTTIYGSFTANQSTNTTVKIPTGIVADIERW